MTEKYPGIGKAFNLCKIHILVRDEEPGGPQHVTAFVLAPTDPNKGHGYALDEAAALQILEEYVDEMGDHYLDPNSIVGIEDMGTTEEGLSEGRFLLWGNPGGDMYLITPEILAIYKKYHATIRQRKGLKDEPKDHDAIETAYRKAWDGFFKEAKVRYSEMLAAREEIWRTGKP